MNQMTGIKKALCLLLSLCLALSAAGCAVAKPKLNKYEDVFYGAFDAAISLTAYCENEQQFEKYFQLTQDEFKRYHKLFDIYFSYSGVNNIKSVNDSASVAPVAVDGEIIELVDFAREMYELSGGSVNIAFGSVLRIWHDIRDYNSAPNAEKKLPDPAELEAAAKHCNMDDVIVDREAGTVYLSDGEMSLDVGAIAKGFAVEKVARLLEAQGCQSAAINAGGNVRTVGLKPAGEKWNIAVTNPDTSSSQAYVDTVETGSAAVVTSGIYQRFFEYEGRRYHHIIDKDTLMPEQRYLSVTIVTADSGYAYALSTAVFNMSLEDGREFVEGLEGVEAMWVLEDKSMEYSAGFHD